MARPPREDLEAFLGRQDAATLALILLDLAGEHEAVRQRLTRLQLADRPDKLAADFRKTLAAWRRSKRFIAYGEAREFGRALEQWLGQIERELLPKDPSAALALAEAFIESDASFFDRADDSDGCIGDAIRAGCRLWLMAAARCESPRAAWPQRLARLAEADEYGAREELLGRAHLLLDESELRQLVGHFESQMHEALARRGKGDQLPSAIYHASGHLSLLADALRDPDVHVRAVLSYSPQPNANQMERFATAYLECDRAADALRWLEGNWGQLEDSRQRLRAQALEQLGRRDDGAPLRQGIFERSLAVDDLRAWLDDLPITAHAQAIARTRELAREHSDPVTAARLLLDLDDAAAAEALLLADPARIRGDDYGGLVPMARALEEARRRAGAAAVYRALLDAILDRANARAYSHAARYWVALQAIAASGAGLDPLTPHAAYETGLRQRHARKAAFWEQVRRAELAGTVGGRVANLDDPRPHEEGA